MRIVHTYRFVGRPAGWGAVFMLTAVCSAVLGGPWVIDHTVVDQYTNIPPQYLDAVKKMWVSVPGESHSSGYRIGVQLLENADNRFQVNVMESGTPEAYTTYHLRFSRASWGDVGAATG